MNLYSKLSKIKFLNKSYAFKFLFITFLGIHIPLIGMLFFVLYGKHNTSPESILIFALIMTLLATAITLFILKRLIKPIELASKALDNYRINRIVPNLPLEFNDEAGLLLSNIQESISENENYSNDKQDLVYLLSHDLRTFAGNSQSLAKLILEENPAENVKEYAKLIHQSTTQQLDFIKSFIQLIKEEDEIYKKVPKEEMIQFDDLFENIHEQVSQQLTMKNIRWISSIEVSAFFIKIDKDLLIRVLVNLIDNAIKFSFPNSEIKVRVAVEKKKLIFEISDSGLGFDSSYKDEIFKKFTTRSRLGTANESSTGIGLYLCKRIVEKYNGKLFAASEGANKGATFSIVFENMKC